MDRPKKEEAQKRFEIEFLSLFQGSYGEKVTYMGGGTQSRKMDKVVYRDALWITDTYTEYLQRILQDI